MTKKKDTFIIKATNRHQQQYSYAFFDYINAKTKGTITCPIHGNFDQRPDIHLAGHGCPTCSGKLKKNISDFIAQATTIHGGKYSYMGFIYEGALHKGVIYCQIHGDFEQCPNAHLAGKGCPKCASSYHHSQTVYITKANKIHHNRYQYSNVNYTSALQKIDITCLIHGDFSQRADAHLRGSGCPKCVNNNQKKTTKQFIIDARKIHGNRYNYSLFEYQNMRTKGIIICTIHDQFTQLPTNHLAGSGCPKCALQRRQKISQINNQPPIKLLQSY
jgi:predicted nucleic-acid-binding Zn-ribbon protein